MSPVPEPSTFVQTFAPMMAAAARELPVLDAACGAGRNAFVLAKLGCQVVCVDKDLRRLEEISKQLKRGPLAMLSKLVRLHPMDLTQDPWPFGAAEFGTIINVHFFLPGLLQHFETSLSPGGYLLVETPPGCGGNYRGLPKAGDVRQMLRPGFDIEHYREGRAGPVVSVKVVARKRKN